MDVLKNAPKRTESGQIKAYAEIFEKLKENKPSEASRLMQAASIGIIHDKNVSDHIMSALCFHSPWDGGSSCLSTHVFSLTHSLILASF